MPSSKPIATFTKNGKTREAYTPADVVKFRFDGWQEKSSSPKKQAAKKAPAKKAAAKKAAKPAVSTAAGSASEDPPTQ